ncbi:hypothetical protein COE09_18030, partial [Bacillus thuringiensis]
QTLQQNPPVNQNFNTPEKSLKSSESFTYSNHVGVKLGVASESKVKAEIPFLGAGEETIKISSEFSYDHNSSNTSTKEETNTFKSQPVVCVEGYTTQFFGTVQNAAFSGTFTGNVELNGKVQIDFDKGGQIILDNSAENLYNVFKYSGMPVPSYIKLDDVHKRISTAVTSAYNGVGGHYSRVVVKVFPNTRSNEDTITMPYAEYMQKAQDGTLKQFLDEKSK